MAVLGRRLAFLAVLALACRLPADGAALVRGSAGPGVYGYGASLSLDLDKAQLWSLSGSYDFQSLSDTAIPSKTNAATLALERSAGAHWTLGFSYNYNNDYLNDIWNSGPELQFQYAYLKHAEVIDDDGNTKITRTPWLQLGLAAQINAYGVSLGDLASSSTSAKGVTSKFGNNQDMLYITQFYPEYSAALPLWGGAVTPSLSYGHYFYSADPDTIAYLVNKRFQNSDGTLSVNTFTGAIFSDAWKGSLEIKFPEGTSLSGDYGQSELINPATWIYITDVTLGQKIRERYLLNLQWSLTEGSPQIWQLEFGWAF